MPPRRHRSPPANGASPDGAASNRPQPAVDEDSSSDLPIPVFLRAYEKEMARSLSSAVRPDQEEIALIREAAAKRLRRALATSDPALTEELKFRLTLLGSVPDAANIGTKIAECRSAIPNTDLISPESTRLALYLAALGLPDDCSERVRLLRELAASGTCLLCVHGHSLAHNVQRACFGRYGITTIDVVAAFREYLRRVAASAAEAQEAMRPPQEDNPFVRRHNAQQRHGPPPLAKGRDGGDVHHVFRATFDDLNRVDAPNRQNSQRRFAESSGYLSHNIGVDMIGPFDHSLFGRHVTVDVRHVSAFDAVPCPHPWTLATDGHLDLVWRPVGADSQSPLPPTHVMEMQALSLCRFVAEFAPPRRQGELRVPLVPDQPEWMLAVERDLASRNCDVRTATEILDHLSAADGIVAPTGFLLRGLPGVGKTSVAVELCHAIGVTPRIIRLGALLGGSYHGDGAVAADTVLLSRARGECGLYIAIINEIDLVTAAGDASTVAQRGAFLDSLVAGAKPVNLCLIVSTNNDWSMVGAIRDRFSRMITCASPSYSQLCAAFALTKHPWHGWCIANRKAPAFLALRALGLTFRDLAPTNLSRSAAQNPLAAIADAHAKKGNWFAVGGSLGRATPGSLAELGERINAAVPHGGAALELSRYLQHAWGNGFLTGRAIMIHAHALMGPNSSRAISNTLVWIDIEERALAPNEVASFNLPDDPHARVYYRSAVDACRNFGPLPCDMALAVLQAFAAARDCTRFTHLTETFCNHASGMSAADSVGGGDDHVSKCALTLVTEFCLARDGAVVVVPASCADVDEERRCAVKRETFGALVGGLFSCHVPREDVGRRAVLVVVQCLRSVTEAAVIADAAGMALSPLVLVAIAAADASQRYQCVVCGASDLKSPDAKGCLHEPQDRPIPEASCACDTHAHRDALNVTSKYPCVVVENQYRVHNPSELRALVSLDVPADPYDLVAEPPAARGAAGEGNQGIERCSFPGLNARETRYVVNPLNGQRLAFAELTMMQPRSVIRVYPRGTTEVFVYRSLANLSDATAVMPKSVAVCCRHCTGRVASASGGGAASLLTECPARRHQPPCFDCVSRPRAALSPFSLSTSVRRAAGGALGCWECGAAWHDVNATPRRCYCICCAQYIPTVPGLVDCEWRGLQLKVLQFRLRLIRAGPNPNAAIFDSTAEFEKFVNAVAVNVRLLPLIGAEPHLRNPGSGCCARCARVDPLIALQSGEQWVKDMSVRFGPCCDPTANPKARVSTDCGGVLRLQGGVWEVFEGIVQRRDDGVVEVGYFDVRGNLTKGLRWNPTERQGTLVPSAAAFDVWPAPRAMND